MKNLKIKLFILFMMKEPKNLQKINLNDNEAEKSFKIYF